MSLTVTLPPGQFLTPKEKTIYFFLMNELVSVNECCLLKEVKISLVTTFGDLIALINLVGDTLLIIMSYQSLYLSPKTLQKLFEGWSNSVMGRALAMHIASLGSQHFICRLQTSWGQERAH